MMIEALSFDFMQNAILAGILASVACGVIGSLVVINRMVFLAGGIAHAAYGGVGIAFFFGLPVLPCAIGFTSAASLLMGMVTLHRTDRTDTIIGLIWAAGMALGIILLDLTPGYNVDLMSFLFGSILAVPLQDLWLMLALDITLVGITLFFYKDFLTMSFDRDFAKTRGVPVVFLHFLLPVMISISVVMIIRIVGLILVIALLTIPPHLAENIVKSLGKMMFLASILSIFFCLAGLAFSYRFDITSGACIISVAATSFFAFLCTQVVKRKIQTN